MAEGERAEPHPEPQGPEQEPGVPPLLLPPLPEPVGEGYRG
ncbi:hypothetical protein ASY01nite_23220 [Acetobacter syzygii]|nr:hypothetical protein Absy_011_032 [Acetobacter syzygii]GEL57256.1 hypothetical protein ASY01nite_23220 [Acetobacter syzygii]